MKENDNVWYACYGSNLHADRFRYYIEGGLCPYNGVQYEGCGDRTTWTDSRIRRFPGDLYFANVSGTWDGKGVAFYDPNGSGTVVMRLYRITWGQLLQVQRQEGDHPMWYGRLVPLGTEQDGVPVYTFTSAQRGTPNPPAAAYLELIRDALINECGLRKEAAETYLQAAAAR